MIQKCRKGKLSIELCRALKWSRKEQRKIWMQPLTIKQIESILKALGKGDVVDKYAE